MAVGCAHPFVHERIATVAHSDTVKHRLPMRRKPFAGPCFGVAYIVRSNVSRQCHDGAQTAASATTDVSFPTGANVATRVAAAPCQRCRGTSEGYRASHQSLARLRHREIVKNAHGARD